MKRSVTVYTTNNSVALVINSVRRDGDRLIIDGKALGEMRMDMIFTPREFFNAIGIALCWGVFSFILLLPFFGLKRILHFRKQQVD